MTERIHNFNAGPAVLPVEVIEEARDNMLSLWGTGLGICEISHRSPEYTKINEEAAAKVKALTGADDDWEVIFVQGGASTQFFTVPMNLGDKGDYVLTGAWSKKALKEAQNLGSPRVAASSEETNFDRIPKVLDLDDDASYVHITANNTIFGTEWREAPVCKAPLVCDASSDIFSRPLQLERYGLIYAGAQKNLGPSGVTLVMIRKGLLARSPASLPTMINYNTHVGKQSNYNTPPVFGVYMLGLVLKWIESNGGLAKMAERNAEKAKLLYDVIDAHDLYQGHVQDADSRSNMNVTWRIAGDDALTARFVDEAKAKGMVGLKGHRSVGGMRASIYNACPLESVQTLAAFMKEFAKANG